LPNQNQQPGRNKRSGDLHTVCLKQQPSTKYETEPAPAADYTAHGQHKYNYETEPLPRWIEFARPKQKPRCPSCAKETDHHFTRVFQKSSRLQTFTTVVVEFITQSKVVAPIASLPPLFHMRLDTRASKAACHCSMHKEYDMPSLRERNTSAVTRVPGIR